jgi:hypothetical protein
MHAAWFRREVQLAAGVRLEVHRVAGCEVRRAVHRVVGSGVWRAVHRAAEVRREVGCRRRVSGEKFVRMLVAGVSVQCIGLWLG